MLADTIKDMMVPTTGYFDFNIFDTDEPDRMSLVDVGGGIGNKLKEILANSPGLKAERCVLQDSESTIAMSKQDNIVPGAALMVHDFWQEQPVKGKSGSSCLVAITEYRQVQKHITSDASCTIIQTPTASRSSPD